MYGDIIGRVVVDMCFDEFMMEKVEAAFEYNNRDGIDIEESIPENMIYIKSTQLEDDDLIDILADNGIEARAYHY